MAWEPAITAPLKVPGDVKPHGGIPLPGRRDHCFHINLLFVISVIPVPFS
jgi:hypothetical protein